MAKHGRTSKRALLWPLASILLLLGLIAEGSTRVQPGDAEPHMQRCKRAIEAIPTNISAAGGMWYGKDVPQPEAATSLLRPNVILSRDYIQPGGPFANTPVSLLIVDCKDARDLQGHYPPNCYPANGQKMVDAHPRTWHLKELEIKGMMYRFDVSRGLMGDEHVVYNFFVTPHVPGTMVSHPELDGAICPDINGIYKSGEDYQRRYYGAAEFQLVTSAQFSPEQIDQAFVDLLEPNLNVIKTLMNRDAGGK